MPNEVEGALNKLQKPLCPDASGQVVEPRRRWAPAIVAMVVANALDAQRVLDDLRSHQLRPEQAVEPFSETGRVNRWAPAIVVMVKANALDAQKVMGRILGENGNRK